jgi:hypothetical protein
MTKEQYMIDAAAWKLEYKELTLEIRAAKHAYKDAQIAFMKVGGDGKYHEAKDSKAYWAAHTLVQNTFNEKNRLRAKATEEIEYRLAMKREAARDAQFAHEGRAKI